LLALPVIWFHSLSLLVAVFPLTIWPGARRLGAPTAQATDAVRADEAIGILAAP
jgi:hypothetical protein